MALVSRGASSASVDPPSEQQKRQQKEHKHDLETQREMEALLSPLGSRGKAGGARGGNAAQF